MTRRPRSVAGKLLGPAFVATACGFSYSDPAPSIPSRSAGTSGTAGASVGGTGQGGAGAGGIGATAGAAGHGAGDAGAGGIGATAAGGAGHGGTGTAGGPAGAAGARATPCKADDLELNLVRSHHAQGASAPTCSRTDEGHMVLRYTPETSCPTSKGDPYRGCVFGNGLDLSAFARGDGALEIVISIPDDAAYGAPEGGVNLWYEDEETGERHNLVILAQSQDRLLGSRTLLFRADDSEGPAHCPDRNPKAAHLCRMEGDPSSDGGHGGQGGEAGAQSTIDATFAKSRLVLMSEWCQAAFTPAPGEELPVRIEMRSARYLPDACFCNDDSECAEGTSCSDGSWPELACCRCKGDCPGVCR